MTISTILVVTGVSGAGKTAAVQALERRARPGIRCFYFDQIGVPSIEAMVRDHGGPEAWQADATKQWIRRLAADAGDVACVLDGQTRPSFVRKATASVPAPIRFQIVLFECTSAVRARRLVARGQPELANATMETWAAYLRGQADALELPVIDTTNLTIEAAADVLEAHVATLALASSEAREHESP